MAGSVSLYAHATDGSASDNGQDAKNSAAVSAAAPIVLSQSTAVALADMTDGEIRKVDLEAMKITIQHSEIKNLEMPGMTMVFQVKDP
jgi:Cu(I)/Ag(I) efflux system periplasmic protein CusF